MFDEQILEEEKMTHHPQPEKGAVTFGRVNKDIIGAIVVGIIALILVMVLLRSQRRIMDAISHHMGEQAPDTTHA